MVLNETQVHVLRAICDTIVPSIAREHDPDGFWGRTATDVGADQALIVALGGLPEATQVGLLDLLDAIAGQGFLAASRQSKEQILRNLSYASRQAAGGIEALRGLTLMLTYGLPDPATGQNPNWTTFGYPGITTPPPTTPKPIAPLVPTTAPMNCDVIVIGSGAGGGVIAGELSRAGLHVMVLEAGGYHNEADFNQSELWAYQNLYWRGGPTPTADMNLTLQAGSCLGGGTVVNWTNSLAPKPWVRQEWAERFGLTDLADDFDRHVEAVWQRLSVNDKCSDLNKPQQAMQRGAAQLGWSFSHADRNADPSTYDPTAAGYMGFGDQTGSKQSTVRTYLQDAADHGAGIIVGCSVDRVVVEGGRAAGVEATWTDPTTGEQRSVTVRAPQVVVAAGALESPGVLLRSGIGGPATGHFLRLHPCTATMGVYGDDLQAWWGPPHAGLIDEFAGDNDGYGFLIEGAQYTTGLAAAATPWLNGEQHKSALSDLARTATFIGLVRDQGSGQVTVDATGATVPSYSLTNPADVANTHAALAAQIRCHAAGGAERIHALAASFPTWHRGDDLEAFIQQVQRIPLRAGGVKLFAAHQMGTCRMGTDPETSVASPSGELHDVAGVWIGDGSAFPTASGTNPMITIMSLAHRTAENIFETFGVTQGSSVSATDLQEASQ